MRKLLIMTAVGISIGVPISAPAFAQAAQSAQPQQQTAKPAKDPNEIVCEKQTALGSRLATQRVCKTRAEWAEERRSTRMDIDKVQMQRDMSH
jgi:invasion protein IalB